MIDQDETLLKDGVSTDATKLNWTLCQSEDGGDNVFSTDAADLLSLHSSASTRV